MTTTLNTPLLSRRSMVAGLAATPMAAATINQSAAQTAAAKTSAQQAQAALKNAKGTKLVLLGTSAGPVPTFRGAHAT